MLPRRLCCVAVINARLKSRCTTTCYGYVAAVKYTESSSPLIGLAFGMYPLIRQLPSAVVAFTSYVSL